MRFLLLINLSLLFISSSISAQRDSVQTRVILIGDAGQLVNGKAMVLDAVRSHIKLDEKTTVVYLGDNLYEAGLPDETYNSYSIIKAALDSQINLVKGTKAKGYMIPGNHDWENGAPSGYETIVRQQQYVDRYGDGKLQFFPKEGCPGPIEVALSDDVVLVMMDSQWWVHESDKPGIESDCEYKTEDEVINELEDILNRNYKKLVLLATHHPFKSNGPHGGYFTIKQHIFPFTDLKSNLYIPLPVIGSAYPIARSVFGSPQDIKHPNYSNMIARVMGVVKEHPHVIMVAGHEHTLQLLKDSSYNFVISGAGSKTNRVSPGGKSEFTARSLGFATLDILNNKSVRVTFFTLDPAHPDSLKTAYTENILDYSKLPPVAPDTTTVKYIYKDYVIAPASTLYEKTTRVQRTFNGNNYRKEWSTPVKLKVFNINTEKGGFTIEGIGGGKQTKSLKLKDKKGVEWSLRTIDKDPDKAIPQNFRESFASNIVQDLISAAHPYAPLTIPTLADTTGIIVATPEFFLVPDDPSLGYYKPLFANKVCMLERKDPAEKQDSKSSYSLFDKMREDNDHTVDQEAVLTARLLDMLIADWDRHFDQWRWATTDTGQGKLYKPIPRDRDQAFFYSDGLIVKYVARRRIPFLKGLRYTIPKINNLNKVAKDFDRMFLNNLDENAWTKTAQKFADRLTDTKINQAIHKMPPEIYAINGKKITDKLIARRNIIVKESLKYYRFISHEVNVLGSNDNEYFRVSKSNGDSIQLVVYSLRKKADTSFVMYQRVFDPHVTKEVRMYGFNGEDRFQIDSGLVSSIRFRIIGGKGDDTVLIKSPIKTFVYDNTNEKNYLERSRRTVKIFENSPRIYEYKINNFNYPIRRFPRFLAGINGDDGLLLGTGFWFINYGFRKEPYASSHKLITLFALTRKAYQIKYNGELVHAFGNVDLLMNAGITSPVLNNFYGFGNTTKIDPAKPVSFYRVRYKEAEAEALFRKRYFSKLSVLVGPTFYQYWNSPGDNKDYILGKPALAGLDSADVYKTRTYAGAKIGVELDNLNSDLFPTRGIRWTNNLTLLQPLNANSRALNKLESDMVIYASLKIPAKVIGVIKMGWGHIFNDSIEYYQALTLGQNNVLRGFRKDRFAGHTVAYGSLELRIKLFDSHSYIFPGQVGLVAFNDIGRVWYNGENSNKWHNVIGGGFYYNPFNLFIVSATVGYSREETVFNFSLGSRFNITF